jgi:hypothetical protein
LTSFIIGLQDDSRCKRRKTATPAGIGRFPCVEYGKTVIAKNIIMGFPANYCNCPGITDEKIPLRRFQANPFSGLQNEQAALIVLSAAVTRNHQERGIFTQCTA